MARRPRSADDHETEAPPPWLEPRARAAAPPADEPGQTVVTWRALVIGGVVALVLAVGLVVGVRSLIGDGGDAGGDGPPGLIRAPAEPYKARPDNPEAPALEGEGETIYDTADGADRQGQLDPNALPEEPQRPAPRDLIPADAAAEDGDAALIGAPSAPGPSAPTPQAPVAPGEGAVASQAPGDPKPATSAAPTAPSPAKPAPPAAAKPAPRPAAPRDIVEATLAPRPEPRPAAAASPGAVQLGAFSSEARAEAVRDRLAARFPDLRSLRVTPVERDGQTLYRLRGQAADTAAACAKLKAAGESCIVAP